MKRIKKEVEHKHNWKPVVPVPTENCSCGKSRKTKYKWMKLMEEDIVGHYKVDVDPKKMIENKCYCASCKLQDEIISPKPTKIKKKLVIKEEWCETTFEQQKDRLYVHMRYFEDDDSGGKWEGGSSSFSVPLKKLKDYLLSH